MSSSHPSGMGGALALEVPRHGSAGASGREWVLTGVYAAVFAATLLLVLTPLAALLYGSFRTAGPGVASDYTLANWHGLLTAGVLGTLLTTCGIAVATSLFSVALGAVMAWILARTDFRWKGTVTVLIALSFFFPGYILAMAWIIIGSPGGIYNALLVDGLGLESLRTDIYSVAGIIWIQILHLTPFAFFQIRAPLMSMDSSFEEAAYMSGANSWQAALRVTAPLMIYPVLSSLLLCFILSIEQFAIPAMVGIPGHVNVLATQLYLLTSFSPPNPGLAAAVGLALSAMTGLSVLLQRWAVRRYGGASITGKSYRIKVMPLGRMAVAANIVCFGYVLLGFVVPGLALIYTSLITYFTANPLEAIYTLRHYTYIFNSPATIRSFVNTLIVAGGGALLGLALGALIAYSTHRLRPGGYRWLDFIASLPFGIPGIVIGLGFLWSYVYLPVYGTIWVLILCYVTRFMPYATETVGAQLSQIDRSLEEAAWMSSASRAGTFVRVVLPLLKPALQSAYFLLFISYFREIASAVLLYTSRTSVISISIWSFFENSNWGAASSLSVISSIIIVLFMSVVSRNLFRTSGWGAMR